MNRDLKFIYPISRVQSIEQLLRTTAHNAFFVVKPLSQEDGKEIEMKLDVVEESKFMPQLYERRSIVPFHVTKTSTDRRRRDAQKERSESTPINFTENENLIVVSDEPKEDSHTPLVFKGIILRSQLVMLLSEGVFFNEKMGWVRVV